MAVSVGELEAILRLRDELSPKLRATVSQIADSADHLRKLGSQAREVGTTLTLGVTAPLVGAGAAALKFSSGFETTMTKVGVLTDLGAQAISGLRKEVLDLAPAVGIGPKELGEGLLIAASTGLRAKESMAVLKESAKATAVGLGDTTAVVRSVTAAMVAYKGSNLTAKDATDKLFVAVREGGADADEFAGTLGRVIGIASTMGVTFDEVVSQIATFTRLGVDADEAVTGLRGTLNNFLHPAKQVRDVLASVGLTADDVRKAIRENGLSATLTELIAKFKGNEDAIGVLIPNVRAMAAVLGTAGAQAEQYAQITDKVRKAHGELDAAFKVTSETLGFRWNALVAEAKVIAIQFGDEISKTAKEILPDLGRALKAVAVAVEIFAKLPQPVREFILAIAALAAAFGPLLFVLGNLASGVGGVIKLFAEFTPVATKAGVAAKLAGAGVTAFSATLALIVVPFALYELIRLFNELGALMDASKGWKIDAAGENETNLKALAAASKLTGEKVTDLGTALSILRGHAASLRLGQQGLVQGMTATNLVFDPYATNLGKAATGSEILAKKVKDMREKLADARKELENLDAATKANIAAGHAMNLSVDEITGALTQGSDAIKISTAAVQLYVDQIDAAAKTVTGPLRGALAAAQKEMAGFSAETKASIKAGDDLGLSVEQIAKSMHVGAQGVQLYVDRLKQMKEETKELEQNFRDLMAAKQQLFVPGATDILPDVLGKENTFGPLVQTIPPQVAAAFAKGLELPDVLHQENFFGPLKPPLQRTVGKAFSAGIGEGLADLPRLLEQALTGGGGLKGFGTALISGVTGGITKNLFSADGALAGFSSKVANMFGESGIGNAIGKAFSAALPGIGALAGPLITAGIGKLLKTEERHVNDLRDAFIDSAGGLDELRRMAYEAGLTLDDLLRAKKVNDFKAAVDEITKALAEQQKVLDKYGITWENMTGAAQQRGLDAAIKDLQREFDALTRAGVDHQTIVEKMGDAYVDLAIKAVKAGKDIPPALAPILKELALMGKLTQDQINALLGLTDANTVDFQRMEEVAKKYGIELDSLGDRFQAAKISDQAKTLIDDFQFLVDNGADFNAVLKAMAGDFQNVVKKALQFGIELPESMRGVLEKLLEQGELTDENGNKLEDLSRINFAKPIEDSIEALIAKLDELIAKITDAGGALGGLHMPNLDTSGFVDGDQTSAPDYPGALPGFRGGSHGVRDWGAGTPVMVHGREAIVPADEYGGGQREVVAAIERLSTRMDQQAALIPILARDAALKAMA